MKRTLVDKAKSILEGIEIGFFDTAKYWDEDNYDEYYRYFSHSDIEVRKYSLLIFAAGLGNWVIGSSIIFRPIKDQKKKRATIHLKTGLIILKIMLERLSIIEMQLNKSSQFYTMQ